MEVLVVVAGVGALLGIAFRHGLRSTIRDGIRDAQSEKDQ